MMLVPNTSLLDAPQPQAVPRPSRRQSDDWREYQRSDSPPHVSLAEARELSANVVSIDSRREQQSLSRRAPSQLRVLQQSYLVLAPTDVTELLERDLSLFTLLSEAVGPLREAFGSDRILQVSVQVSDDDALLCVAVQLPAGTDDAEARLQSFDTAWWLDNCHRGATSLVFDYEIQDGV